MRFSIVPCLFMTIAKNSMPKRVKERLRDSLKGGLRGQHLGNLGATPLNLQCNSVEPSV